MTELLGQIIDFAAARARMARRDGHGMNAPGLVLELDELAGDKGD